jgi:glycosyltransferase involved in cell wall biosynthesis
MSLQELTDNDYELLYAAPSGARPGCSLSIVTPTYDRPGHLLNLVRSLQQQEDCDLSTVEMVIVDDGGDAEAVPALRAMALSFGLRYYRHPRRGRRVGRARNIGIREARGEIILFLDADALASPHVIADHLAQHRGQARLMVQGQMYELKPGKSPLFRSRLGCDLPFGSGKRLLISQVRRFQQTGLIFLHSRNRRGLCFCTMHASVRRCHLLQTSGFDHAFDGRWGDEDVDLGYQLEKAGVRLRWANRAFVYHQWHPVTLQENVRDNRIALLLKHPELIDASRIGVMPNPFRGCTRADLEWLHAREIALEQPGHSAAAPQPAAKTLLCLDPCPDVPPVLSLIVTTCNRESFVDGFLHSLKRQTLDLRQVELIVVDDGGSDQTLDRIRNAGLPCRVRYVWQEKQGFRAASSRNNGLRAASADVIVITDMDALLDRNFLEAHRQSQEGQSGRVFCGLAYYLPPRTRLPERLAASGNLQGFRSLRFRLKQWVESIRQPYLAWLARQGRYPLGTVVSTINCSFRRSGPGAGAGFDGNFDGIYGDEDIEFFHRLCQAGCTVHFLNEALIFHRWHPHDPHRGWALENRCLMLMRHPDLLQQRFINLQVNPYFGKNLSELRCHRLWLQRLRFMGKHAFTGHQRGIAIRSAVHLLLPAWFFSLRHRERKGGPLS